MTPLQALFITMPPATSSFISQLSQKLGVKETVVAVMMLEYLAYSLYRKAPMELEAFLPMIIKQSQNDHVPLDDVSAARTELLEILELTLN